MKIVILQPLGINHIEELSQYKSILKLGHDIQYFTGSLSDQETLLSIIKEVDVIVDVNYPLQELFLSKCSNLKMISIVFTGYDHVDIEYCKRQNIIVCNSVGYATNAVAVETIY